MLMAEAFVVEVDFSAVTEELSIVAQPPAIRRAPAAPRRVKVFLGFMLYNI
jgi:hypothetical protein